MDQINAPYLSSPGVFLSVSPEATVEIKERHQNNLLHKICLEFRKIIIDCQSDPVAIVCMHFMLLIYNVGG